MDLASFSIFPATKAQIRESRNRTYPEWGKNHNITLEEYLARDYTLDKFEHADQGRLITWVLAPVSDPETTNFMCSCETFQREGLYCLPGSATPKPCTCYGIASVYTPPANRRKGYASRMMRILHWAFSPHNESVFPSEWGTPPAGVGISSDVSFSILYADVGPEFYENCGMGEADGGGWKVTSSIGTIFDVATLQEKLNSAGADATSWRWLDEKGALDAWERDSAEMQRDMSKSPSDSLRVCTLPRRGVAAYLKRRGLASRPPKSPEISPEKAAWGVEITRSDGEMTYATWSADPQPQPPPNPVVLAISRIRSSRTAFPEVLRAICAYAAKQEPPMTKIEIWNVPESLLAAANEMGLEGKTGPRKEHLNSMKVYWGQEKADCQVEWMFNERCEILSDVGSSDRLSQCRDTGTAGARGDALKVEPEVEEGE